MQVLVTPRTRIYGTNTHGAPSVSGHFVGVAVSIDTLRYGVSTWRVMLVRRSTCQNANYATGCAPMLLTTEMVP